MGSMDEILPKVMLETIQVFLVILGINVMVVAMNYWMLIPLTVFLILFYFTRNTYLRTAQSIKRLEGIGKYFTIRLPIFMHSYEISRCKNPN